MIKIASDKNKRIFEKFLNIELSNKTEQQAHCPFHRDSNPSFSFNTEKGVFYCHSCGEKGNTIRLVEILLGVHPKTQFKNVIEFINFL